MLFLKEGVHKWARRDSDNCPNDIKRSELEKEDLGASFEPYNGNTSWLMTLLRLIKVMGF